MTVAATAPTDPYDPAWIEWNEQHPGPRSVGAAAAEGDEGDGDAGEQGSGDEGGDGQDGDGDAAHGASGDGDSGDGGEADKGKKAAEGDSEGEGDGDDGKAKPNGEAADWRETITDEKARKHADRFSSPAELAEDAFKLRQKLSNAVFKPSKSASQEEVAAFRKAMGVPETADDYEISLPEGLPEHLQPNKDGEESLKSFRETAHEAGISDAQFGAMTEWYFKSVQEQEAAMEKALETARERSEAKLRKEMGADFDTNVKAAAHAAEHFGGQEFKDMIETVTLDGVNLGDHPTFLKTFAPIGRMLKEGDPLIGMSDEQRTSLEEEHETLTKGIHEAYNKGDTIEAERLQTKRSQISAKISRQAPADRGI